MTALLGAATVACAPSLVPALLVVWAIAEGREAARHVDAFLTGLPSALPARDRSLLQIGLPTNGSNGSPTLARQGDPHAASASR